MCSTRTEEYTIAHTELKRYITKRVSSEEQEIVRALVGPDEAETVPIIIAINRSTEITARQVIRHCIYLGQELEFVYEPRLS